MLSSRRAPAWSGDRGERLRGDRAHAICRASPEQPLSSGPGSQRRQLRAADPAQLSRACCRRVSAADRLDLRRPPDQLCRLPHPLPAARVRPGPPRHPARRHRHRHGAQHPGDPGGAFRRGDGGRGPERAQHPGRGRHGGLHPRPQRIQAAAHRHRVRPGGEGCAGTLRRPSRGDRHCRRPAARRRPAPRQDHLRGAAGRG